MLKAFVENFEEPLILTDDNFSVIAASSSLKFLFGHNKPEGFPLKTLFVEHEFNFLLSNERMNRKSRNVFSLESDGRKFEFQCSCKKFMFNGVVYYYFILNENRPANLQQENFNVIIDLSMLMISTESSMEVLSDYVYSYFRRTILVDSVAVFLPDDKGRFKRQVSHNLSCPGDLSLPLENPDFMSMASKRDIIRLEEISHMIPGYMEIDNYLAVCCFTGNNLKGICLLYWKDKAPFFERAALANLEQMVDTYVNSLFIWREFDDIREKNRVIDSVLDNVNSFIYVSDPDTYELVFVNKTMREGLELVSEETVKCYEAFHQKAPCESCPLSRIRDAEDGYIYAWEKRSQTSENIYMNYDSMIIWNDGRRLHMQNSVDSTQLFKMMRRASIDAMTGAYNKQGGLDALEGLSKMALAQKEIVTLCYIDVNDLKKVNDKYGHSYGDKLIISVSETVLNTIRGQDIFCRVGGDEFFIAFANVKKDVVEKIMARILYELSKVAEIKDFPFEVSVSYGIKEVELKAENAVRTALNEADTLMYEYKNKWKQEHGKKV